MLRFEVEANGVLSGIEVDTSTETRQNIAEFGVKERYLKTAIVAGMDLVLSSEPGQATIIYSDAIDKALVIKTMTVVKRHGERHIKLLLDSLVDKNRIRNYERRDVVFKQIK